MAELFLVGVDGSDGSRRAVRFAAEQARRTGAGLVIAHAIDWSPYAILPPQELADRHRQREEELARAASEVLAPLADEARRLGAEVETIARHGHPAATLAALATERGVQQVFVGRRGLSKLQALLFGSVSSGLAQVAGVPVTIVP